MNNDEVLDHLLKIESEAVALVNDAQAEADKRVLDAEKQYHAAYEERYRAESEKLEREFQQLREGVRQRYRTELAAYTERLASVSVDTGRFSALLNKLVMGEA